MNMKKITLHGIILSVVLLLALSTVSGQGFFIHNHTLQFSSARTKVLPNGYEVQLLESLANQQTCLYKQSLSPEGEELDWSAECSVFLGGAWLSEDLRLDVHADQDTTLYVVKRTVDGDTIWWSQLTKPAQWSYSATSVQQNAAGAIFFCGRANQLVFPFGVHFFGAKYDSGGALQWFFDYPVNTDAAGGIEIVDTPGDDCVYSLTYNNSSMVVDSLQKRGSNGALLWSHAFPNGDSDFKADNGPINCAFTQSDSAGNYVSTLRRYDAAGNPVWAATLNSLFPATNVDVSIVATSVDHNILVLGQEAVGINVLPYKPFAALFDTNGNMKWKKILSTGWFQTFASATPTPDGGFVIVGSLDDLASQFNIVYAMKIDSGGVVYPGTLSGHLAVDANVNCLVDPPETPAVNWKVLAVGNEAYFAVSDTGGMFFNTSLPAGNYTVSVVPPSNLWESCPASASFNIPNSGATEIEQDFALSAIADCPAMSVSVSTWSLRRCMPNTYTVHYCNDGTVAADSAVVQIILDPVLDFNSASIPYTLDDDDVLTFQLGTVESLHCGSFTFSVTPNCDETEIGQTVCVSASIYPDTLCNPPANWSGATLVGSAACEGDSVRFVLKNTGNGPSTPGLNFVVVDDHVIMMQAPLPALLPQDKYETTMPSNGNAWRFLAEQEPNHPQPESVSVGVEGCNGPVQPGLLLEFPNTDGRPATARDCQELIGSWDPNDKSAAPRGMGDAHYIRPGTPLTYHIRFQNTGTDTAFTIVVRDTLAAWLDPAALRLGASSHPYSFDLLGNGIAVFTFNNVALPDSNVNEAASQGFVEFSIDQKADIPLGTVLENRAGIYFDFNPVVLTNTVWHTVEEDFLTIISSTSTPAGLEQSLRIFPNPAAGEVWVDTPGGSFASGDRLFVYNALDKPVAQYPATGARMELSGKLPSGIYFVEWRSGALVKGRGKLVLK